MQLVDQLVPTLTLNCKWYGFLDEIIRGRAQDFGRLVIV